MVEEVVAETEHPDGYEEDDDSFYHKSEVIEEVIPTKRREKDPIKFWIESITFTMIIILVFMGVFVDNRILMVIGLVILIIFILFMIFQVSASGGIFYDYYFIEFLLRVLFYLIEMLVALLIEIASDA